MISEANFLFLLSKTTMVLWALDLNENNLCFSPLDGAKCSLSGEVSTAKVIRSKIWRDMQLNTFTDLKTKKEKKKTGSMCTRLSRPTYSLRWWQGLRGHVHSYAYKADL